MPPPPKRCQNLDNSIPFQHRFSLFLACLLLAADVALAQFRRRKEITTVDRAPARTRSPSPLFDKLLHADVFRFLRALPNLIHPRKRLIEIHLLLSYRPNLCYEFPPLGDSEGFATLGSPHELRELLPQLMNTDFVHDAFSHRLLERSCLKRRRCATDRVGQAFRPDSRSDKVREGRETAQEKFRAP